MFENKHDFVCVYYSNNKRDFVCVYYSNNRSIRHDN